jgi:hypothetical protein
MPQHPESENHRDFVPDIEDLILRTKDLQEATDAKREAELVLAKRRHEACRKEASLEGDSAVLVGKEPFNAVSLFMLVTGNDPEMTARYAADEKLVNRAMTWYYVKYLKVSTLKHFAEVMGNDLLR